MKIFKTILGISVLGFLFCSTYIWIEFHRETRETMDAIRSNINSMEHSYPIKNDVHSSNSDVIFHDIDVKSLYEIETQFMRNWVAFIGLFITATIGILPFIATSWVEKKEDRFNAILDNLKNRGIGLEVDFSNIKKELQRINSLKSVAERELKRARSICGRIENESERIQINSSSDTVSNKSFINCIDEKLSNPQTASAAIEKLSDKDGISDFKKWFDQNIENEKWNLFGVLNYTLKKLNALDPSEGLSDIFKRKVKYYTRYLINKGFDEGININTDYFCDLTKDKFLGDFKMKPNPTDASVFNYLIKIAKELEVSSDVIDNIRSWRDGSDE